MRIAQALYLGKLSSSFVQLHAAMPSATCRKRRRTALLISMLTVAEARRISQINRFEIGDRLRQDVGHVTGSSSQFAGAVGVTTRFESSASLARFLLDLNPTATLIPGSLGAQAHKRRLSTAGLHRPTCSGQRKPSLVMSTTPESDVKKHKSGIIGAVQWLMPFELRDDQEMLAAAVQTSAAVALGMGFAFAIYETRGYDDFLMWLNSYVLEESLSVDNLFVFSLIFDYFQTPKAAQSRVLRWGLIVACALRALFIVGGLAVIEQFRGVLLVFAGILIYSSYGLLAGGDDEPEDLSQNEIVKLTKKYLPTTDQYDEDKFFTTIDGQSIATPLLLALICVEVSDVIFAFDSVPAVFGVTSDPFLAFTSNAFALLGLRSIYKLIDKAKDTLEYLQPAIAIVLGFIGLKLAGSWAGYEVDNLVSLLVVFITLGTGTAVSVVKNSADQEEPTK